MELVGPERSLFKHSNVNVRTQKEQHGEKLTYHEINGHIKSSPLSEASKQAKISKFSSHFYIPHN